MGKAKPLDLFNLDAESSLIGAVLLGGREVLESQRVGMVQPVDFWGHHSRDIWTAVLAVSEQEQAVDQVTVADELQKRGQLGGIGGEAVLLQMVNACPSFVRADSYAAVVLDWSRRRRVRQAISGLGAAIHSNGSFDGALKEALETLREASSEGIGPIEPQGAGLWDFRTLEDAYTERKPLEFAIEGLFPLPSLSIVYGAPGCLKSFLLADAALCVASGTPWLSPIPTVNDTTPRETTLLPAVWVDFDNGTRRTDERVEALARARDLDSNSTPFYYTSMPSPWLDGSDSASIDALACRLEELRAGIVVVDNLGVVSGGADENSAQMIRVLSNFRRLAESTGAAIILVHHQRKASGFHSHNGETLRGHSSILAALDLALLVERESGSSQVSLKGTKNRDIDVLPFGAIFTYEHRADSQELARARFWGTPVEDTSSDSAIRRAIMETAGDEPEIQKEHLIETVKDELPEVGVNRVRRQIDNLVGDGVLEETRGGKTGRAKCYTLA